MKASIKEQELRSVVGKTVSFNSSPTLRAKLIKINRKTCVLEVMPTEYEPSLIGSEFVGKIIKAPLDHTWNAYFY